jgi:hypothetical protein
MTNPFDPNYLATPSAQFGFLAWLFFALQIAGALAGLYIWYIRTDSNPVRRALWRQLGIGLTIVGGVGVLFALLRLADVPFFNRRFWFYLLLLLDVVLGIYVLYFARTSYPKLVAAAQTNRSRAAASGRPMTQQRAMAVKTAQPAAKASAPNAPPSVPEPPVRTTSTRREARRERKRRSR